MNAYWRVTVLGRRLGWDDRLQWWCIITRIYPEKVPQWRPPSWYWHTVPVEDHFWKPSWDLVGEEILNLACWVHIFCYLPANLADDIYPSPEESIDVLTKPEILIWNLLREEAETQTALFHFWDSFHITIHMTSNQIALRSCRTSQGSQRVLPGYLVREKRDTIRSYSQEAQFKLDGPEVVLYLSLDDFDVI
jgi:hypothetical protein